MAEILLGRVGKQPPRQILPAHKSRRASARSRNRTMDDHLPRHRPRVEDDIKRANCMWSHIKSALRNLLHKQQVESELDDEIASYVAAITDEKIAAGLPPQEARRRALAECGGTEHVKQARTFVSESASCAAIPPTLRPQS